MLESFTIPYFCSMNFDILLQSALGAASRASGAILRVKSGGFDAWSKSDASPVTEADLASNEVLVSELASHGIPILSEEEKEVPYATRKNWTTYWLLDPLDGTKEFVKGLPEFTVNIALIHQGEPILGVIAIPEQHKVYYAANSQAFVADIEGEAVANPRAISPSNAERKLIVAASRSHLSPATSELIDEMASNYDEVEIVRAGSALKFCMIAEGTAHVYPRFTPCMEWDTAAAHAILRNVGLNICRMADGLPLEYNKESLLNPPFIAQ